MGKRKSGGRRGVGRKITTVDSDDELRNEEEPDPNSRRFIYDEIDEFHENREKALLDAGKPYKVQRQTDNEEVFSLQLSSDDGEEYDDEDEEYDDDNVSRFTAMQKKDEMESDLEDEEDDVDETNWGKRKSNYYSTDYLDKDYQTFNESDIELAEAEEREAKALQLKLAERLDDADFGLDMFEKAETVSSENKMETKIERDLSSMTKRERLEILNRESPELINLLNDLKVKLIEIRDHCQPQMDMVRLGEMPAGAGADYIRSKYHLLLNYCTNVCFYIMLKSKRESLKYHPIVETLVTYRKLIKELESLDEQFEKEKKRLLKRGNLEDTNNVNKKDKSREKKSLLLKKSPVTLSQSAQLIKGKKQSLAIVSENVTASPDDEKMGSSRKRKAAAMIETEDEKNALELYKLMKDGHKRKLDEDDSETDDEEASDEEKELSPVHDNEVGEIDEDTGKRGITYQIAKNKGLTPYRAKERRNPRVKYRMKYRKAKIRRKGQVRDVRNEISKYGGEFSGIKASTVRSIKLK